MAETKMTSMNTVWIQAIAGGAFTLIPARKYPAWLRHTLTWGSTAGIFTVMAVPGVASKLQELTTGKTGSEKAAPKDVDAETVGVPSDSVEGVGTGQAGTGKVDGSKPDFQEVDSNPVVRIGLAAAVAACTYGVFRFSFWFDGAAERGLRKLHVPYPRVVMGLGVAALYVVTEKFDRKYEARAGQSSQSDQH
ncbi:hypothetical protein [Kocuria carniphila]|uniref:hypothetical protein n=1 Tax=Kocuria carniphila TaxID=262208 RepID=UPI00101D98EA|nr:hypothetical protein [Kocuria carniphila]